VIGGHRGAVIFIALTMSLLGGLMLLLERMAPVTKVALPASQIRHREGLSFIAPLAEQLAAASPWWPLRLSPVDLPESAGASPQWVVEDDRRLGPAHTQHDAVARLGGGAFSVWGDAVYFSSSDGSDPRHGSRRYQLELHSELPAGLRVLGWSLSGLGSMALLVMGMVGAGRWLTAIADRPRRGAGGRARALAAALAMACCATAAALALAAGRTGAVVLPVHPSMIQPAEGRAFAVALEPLRAEAAGRLWPLRRPGPSDVPGAQRRSRILLHENGAPLPRPHAQFAEIASRGEGRYMVWGSLLAFSTADGRDPRAEGASYAVEFDARPAPRITLLCGGLLLLGALLFSVAMPARLWRWALPALCASVPGLLLLLVLRWPTAAWVAGAIPPGMILLAILLWLGNALAACGDRRTRCGWPSLRRCAPIEREGCSTAPTKPVRQTRFGGASLRGLSVAGLRLRRLGASLLHRLEGSLGAGVVASLVALSLLLAWSPVERPEWRLEASRGFGAFEGRGQATDALGYLANSQWLLWTGEAQPFGARRPIFTSWLAGVSSIAGLDLQALVAAQALLLAAALWLAMRSIGRHVGSAVALVAGAIALGFAQQFIGVTMTETLGLPLGLLAVALLLPAARSASPALLAGGSSALALALIVRPGAILVLPLLPLALAWVARRHHRRSAVAAAGWSLLGIVAALAINAGLEGRMGRTDAASNSNAGYVLYGLSVGRDWTAGEEWLQRNAPELGEREQASRLMAAAMENIRRDPRPFARSLGSALRSFLTSGPPQLSAHFADRGVLAVDAPWWRSPAFVVWGVLGAMLLCWRLRGHPATAPMLVAMLAGVLLSIPLIWGDGGWRALAATLPLQAVIVAFFLAPSRAPALRQGPDRGPLMAGATMFALLAICAFGAWIVPGRLERRPRPLVTEAGHAIALFTAPASLRCVRIEPTPSFRWFGPASLTLEESRLALADWNDVPALQCLLERIDPARPHMIAQTIGVNRRWGLVGATILVPPELVDRVEAQEGALATLTVEWCASTLYFGEVGVLKEIAR